MTVDQLLIELCKLPGDAQVHVEGCDCYRDATGVTYEDGYLLITST